LAGQTRFYSVAADPFVFSAQSFLALFIADRRTIVERRHRVANLFFVPSDTTPYKAAVGFAFGLFPIFGHLLAAQPELVGAFAIGILAADASVKNTFWRKHLLWVTLAAVAATILGAVILRHQWAINIAFGDIPRSVLQGCLLIYLSQARSSFAAKFFTLKPFEILGEFSYSLYLIHFPLLVAFAMIVPHNHWYFAWMCAAVVPVLLLAYGFHYVFERPFMRWKNPA
jgi:peptidoglycan/LPS O-acetylase OafA/YrhL